MPEENENTNRRIGYARVPTASQELNLQLDALKLAGIPDNLFFIDKVSGAKTERQVDGSEIVRSEGLEGLEGFI